LNQPGNRKKGEIADTNLPWTGSREENFGFGKKYNNPEKGFVRTENETARAKVPTKEQEKKDKKRAIRPTN